MLVIDSSAAVESLLARRHAMAVERSIASQGGDLRAPHLLDLEVLNALRRIVAAGEASAERADEAVGDLLTMPVERLSHQALVPRMWTLRHNFTAYDASYVALAERLDAPLLTVDARLARAIEAHTDIDVLLAA